MLAAHTDQKLRVLVVWEPMLPTDWRAPSGSTLSRFSDGRVRQFWDPHHLVASALNEIAKQKPPNPEPSCCFDKGFYWDGVILYPAGTRWQDPPTSVFWNGPIVHAIPNLETALATQH